MDEKQICWDLIIIDSRNSAPQSRSFVASRTIKFARISSSYVPQYVTVAKNYEYIDIKLPNNHCLPVGYIVHKNWFSGQVVIGTFEKRAQVKKKTC